MKRKYIALAAGGTGGHIFPAVALAEGLLQKDAEVTLFTDKRFDAYAGALPKQLGIRRIAAASLAGGVLRKVKSILLLFLGAVQSCGSFLRKRPAVVVGFGGYPSYPVLVAAMLLRIPVVLHEQNAVLGRVNRFFASYARHIATSFAQTSHLPNGCQKKVVWVGNPVKQVFLDAYQPYSIPKKQFHLLVVGGSLGASVFSDVVPDAVALLPETLRAKLHVTQQVRKGELKEVKARYKALSVHAELAPFFTHMPELFAQSHLVLARAGASTIAEIAATGRPSIFIPYPHAMDDHQYKNAVSFTDGKAGMVFRQEELDAALLAKQLISFINKPASLAGIARVAKQQSMEDAVAKLVSLALECS